MIHPLSLPINFLEAEVQFSIEEIVVVLVGVDDRAIVHTGILHIHLQVLSEEVVHANLIHGL